MTSTTNISNVRYLSECMRIEQTLGAIYHCWGQSTLFDEEIQKLWLQMECEEYDHAHQIDMLRRMILRCAVGERTIDDQQVLAMVEYTQNCLEGVKTSPMTVQEILTLALRLEDQFREFHVLQAFRFEDPALRKLFSNLSRDDESHLQKIKDVFRQFGA